MSARPGWHDEYWKRLDKNRAKKMRTSCPRCGSSNTYYMKQYRTWRCGRCEYIFKVKGYGDKTWWQRLFPWLKR